MTALVKKILLLIVILIIFGLLYAPLRAALAFSGLPVIVCDLILVVVVIAALLAIARYMGLFSIGD